MRYCFKHGKRDQVAKRLRAYAHAKRAQHKSSGGVLLGYTYGWLVSVDTMSTIFEDMMFALGALAFVFMFVWWHLRSFFVTWCGLAHIMLSFYVAYVMYKLVFFVEMMNLMNLLMVFVVSRRSLQLCTLRYLRNLLRVLRT